MRSKTGKKQSSDKLVFSTFLIDNRFAVITYHLEYIMARHTG